MPSEVWKHATQADCAGVVAVAVHSFSARSRAKPEWPLDFSKPWVKSVCGGAMSRAVFLVRHPFVAAWASLLARRARDPNIRLTSIQSTKNRSHRFWSDRLHAAAILTAKEWLAMIDYRGHVEQLPRRRQVKFHVDWSWRMWRRSGRASMLFRMEDFQAPGRASYELSRLIDFVFDGQPTALVINPRTHCAIERATQMHDAHRQGALVVDREQVRRALEYERFGTGDAMWKVVSEVAEQLDYTRHGYYELIPPCMHASCLS